MKAGYFLFYGDEENGHCASRAASGPKEMAVFLFLQAQTIAQDKMKNTHICNKFTKKVTKNIKIDH